MRMNAYKRGMNATKHLIRPEKLPPLARAELREAFNAIGRAHSSSTDLFPSAHDIRNSD
jgi:hypothetical protein